MIQQMHQGHQNFLGSLWFMKKQRIWFLNFFSSITLVEMLVSEQQPKNLVSFWQNKAEMHPDYLRMLEWLNFLVMLENVQQITKENVEESDFAKSRQKQILQEFGRIHMNDSLIESGSRKYYIQTIILMS